jgi:hypothetical protein
MDASFIHRPSPQSDGTFDHAKAIELSASSEDVRSMSGAASFARRSLPKIVAGARLWSR